MTKKPIILTALLGICVIFLNLTCCKDCPDCPTEPEPEPLGHYRLYVWDGANNLIMSVDTPADTIVDSIRVDFSGWLFINGDGGRLIALNYENQSTEVFDARDLSHIMTVNQYGDYFFDPNGNYAIFNSFEKLYFIDPVTLLPIDSISRIIFDCYLDTVNNLFFGTNGEVDTNGTGVARNVIFKIDCDSRELVDSFAIYTNESGSAISVNTLAHNWLTGDLYFHGSMEPFPYRAFFHYDTEADSIVSVTRIYIPNGGVAVSPDGKSVYMTDAGDPIRDIFPEGYIWVYDAFTHGVKDLVPSVLIPEGQMLLPFHGDIVPTPDGRRLYVGCSRNGGWTPAVVVDLLEMKIINRLDFLEPSSHPFLALGPVPD